jgi:hypothetical protein
MAGHSQKSASALLLPTIFTLPSLVQSGDGTRFVRTPVVAGMETPKRRWKAQDSILYYDAILSMQSTSATSLRQVAIKKII